MLAHDRVQLVQLRAHYSRAHEGGGAPEDAERVAAVGADLLSEACRVAYQLDREVCLLKPVALEAGAQGLLAGGNQVLVLTLACRGRQGSAQVYFCINAAD